MKSGCGSIIAQFKQWMSILTKKYCLLGAQNLLSIDHKSIENFHNHRWWRKTENVFTTFNQDHWECFFCFVSKRFFDCVNQSIPIEWVRQSADSNYRPRAIITEATELKNFVWFVLLVLPAVVGCGLARFEQLEVNTQTFFSICYN